MNKYFTPIKIKVVYKNIKLSRMNADLDPLFCNFTN